MIFIEERDNRFYIDKSTIENAGYGCFAKEKIKKGDFLEIIGVMVRKGSVADFCTHYANNYKFMGDKKTGKIVPFGYGGMVNHTDIPEKQNVFLTSREGYNKISHNASHIVYEALRDIMPGEELLGNYGPSFDKVIKMIQLNLTEKEIWNKFISYDLYNLKEIIDQLPQKST